MSDCNIFGYMRFSYIGRSDARLSRMVTDDEKFDLMFNENRMAQRFYIFENITLPSLRAQTNRNWKLDILISKVMQQVYKDRLQALVGDIEQIDVLESDAPNVVAALQPVIAERTASDKRTIHFRTDDDDALSCHAMTYLEGLREHAPKRCLINMPNGFLLYSDGTESSIWRKFEHWVAICWALVNSPGEALNPYNFIHGGYWLQNPSITLPHFPAYIQSAHDSCDTQPANAKKLRKAIQHSPDYASIEDKRQDVDRACKRHFPWTTHDRLIEIFDNMPIGHKTAVWAAK